MSFQGQRRGENATKWSFQEMLTHLALVQDNKGHRLPTGHYLIPGRFSRHTHPLNLVRASMFNVFINDEPQEKYPAQSSENQDSAQTATAQEWITCATAEGRPCKSYQKEPSLHLCDQEKTEEETLCNLQPGNCRGDFSGNQ